MENSGKTELVKSAESFRLSLLPDSEVELTGEVSFETLVGYRSQALAHLGEHAELPGFRKGHVPLAVVEKKVGEMAILEEAAEIMLRALYPRIIEEKKLEVVGRPDIRITKLAPGNPLELVIRTAVFPALALPDYKRIVRALPEEALAVATDEEVEKAIETMRQSRGVKKEGQDTPEVPELTDEFVKTLGAFDSVSAFKEKLKEHIGAEKEREAKEKRRGKIADALIEKTKVEVPRLFIESELEKMVGQMKDDIGRMGLKWEDYLSHIKKTEGDMRKEFRDQAHKRAVLQLALNAIAEKEDIKVGAEDIEREASRVLAQFKDADRERVHIYAESVLKNEKTLQFLEGEGRGGKENRKVDECHFLRYIVRNENVIRTPDA